MEFTEVLSCIGGRVQDPSSLTCASFLTLEGHLSFEFKLRKTSYWDMFIGPSFPACVGLWQGLKRIWNNGRQGWFGFRTNSGPKPPGLNKIESASPEMPSGQ